MCRQLYLQQVYPHQIDVLYAIAGGDQKLPDSLFGAVLIGGFIVMLLLDQVHTAVAKGKTFQTSPPPTDNDPEDPWKVQVAKPGPPRKHVWVSWHSINIVHCPLRGRRSFCVVSVADGCLRSSHHIDCVRPASDPLCDLQTKTGSDSASRAFVGLLVHSAAGELNCCPVAAPSCGT